MFGFLRWVYVLHTNEKVPIADKFREAETEVFESFEAQPALQVGDANLLQ
jgi:hypothetical protein